MKPLLVVCVCLVALLIGTMLPSWFAHETPEPTGPAAASTGPDELREAIAQLTRRLEALERAAPTTATVERGDAAKLAGVPAVAPADVHDAMWYLDQYVASFADDAQGLEYYRLAVDAHVGELVAPIAALVRDGARPAALRQALAGMLGRRRFQDSPGVIDALLAALRPPAPDTLALRALEALACVASPAALPGLEATIPLLREANVRERAVALVVELAADDANAALMRLFARAPDDALRRLLLRHLNGAESVAALELLRQASACEQPVRLDAARKVHEYDEPAFDTFVATWRQTENDGEVRAALGVAGQPGGVAGWSAKKATGAPDADRTRDDPNAWAPRNPEMGLQWLQLTYAQPVRAHGVRIFEVNAPGAIAEVLAAGPDGRMVSLWRGTANGGASPLVLSFPLTAFAVRTIKLVLDTDRTPGWNEIDAVELLSPDGAQWAQRATASSSYGAGRVAAGDAERVERMQLERALWSRK